MTDPGIFRTLALLAALAVFACPLTAQAPAPSNPDNPFFQKWETPFETPPFDKIRNAHFLPAIREGMARQKAEIAAITSDQSAPTFDNTIARFDESGQFLSRVTAVFFSLQSAETNPELQALAKEAAPELAAHNDNINLDPALFARVKAVHDRRAGLKLDAEQLFLLENMYKDFVRGGALLDEAGKARLRQINKELSLLSVKFGDNLLGETNAGMIVVDKAADLAGLPPSVVAMGAETARQKGMEGKWVFTVQVPSMTPFLQYAESRPLREQLHKAYCARGDQDNARDNKATILSIVALRAEKARLLGYPTFADFVLEKNMAKTPKAVNDFLARLWTPSQERARMELREMQAIADRGKAGYALAHWDWWLYAEKLRKEKYALDEGALRPYFKLDNVRDGIFTLCDRLYGIKFVPLKGVSLYHPDVQVFEVREADGKHLGLLYMDFFPRSGKRGGAWCGAFRRAWGPKDKRVTTHSYLVCNFTRPTADEPALLSQDEVETFFHEFGHALNGLFADGRYRNRDIPRDAVELPSQIMENWAMTPELLSLYARHYQTGAVMPKELMDKVQKAALFNQGFATTEYLAASILDMDWHTMDEAKIKTVKDVDAFEKNAMSAVGLMGEIVPRYRSTYFNHIFAGGYSAGYYAYIWAGVLDSDAFEAFKEKGLFDRATAESFRHNVLARLGSQDAMECYKRFRGAEPSLEPLLRRRGLIAEKTAPAEGAARK